MKAILSTCGLAAGLIFIAATSTPVQSRPAPRMGTFDVTITNLTRSQIFAPAVLATHRGGSAMFSAGTPASAELQILAEDGAGMPLAQSLDVDKRVFSTAVGKGAIHPGQSETITISADRSYPRLSMASMLVSTNDVFAGLSGIRLPARSNSVLAHGYDAGTEFNSEDCTFIPGPPCGNGGVHDPRPAEGFIYISNGIHGIGGLNEAEMDWTGPVARVKIVRR